MEYKWNMQTVVETPGYLKAAEAIFSLEERDRIVAMVAANPECGEHVVTVLAGGSGWSQRPQCVMCTRPTWTWGLRACCRNADSHETVLLAGTFTEDNGRRMLPYAASNTTGGGEANVATRSPL